MGSKTHLSGYIQDEAATSFVWGKPPEVWGGWNGELRAVGEASPRPAPEGLSGPASRAQTSPALVVVMTTPTIF